jgi:hypothetical protein
MARRRSPPRRPRRPQQTLQIRVTRLTTALRRILANPQEAVQIATNALAQDQPPR